MYSRLKNIRENSELTQAEFSNRLKISRSEISLYENQKRTPTPAMITAICREFHVNEHWLRTGEGEMYIEQSSDLELLNWLESLLREKPDSFQVQLLHKLSKFSDSEWNTLKKMTNFYS